MTARIHPYVPKLYLRGFSCNRRQRKVCVVDGIEPTVFACIPNVAAERDFNRIDLVGIDPDKLEADLSEFETKAAAAITRTRRAANFQVPVDRTLYSTHLPVSHPQSTAPQECE